jgi:hypothetical protein
MNDYQDHINFLELVYNQQLENGDIAECAYCRNVLDNKGKLCPDCEKLRKSVLAAIELLNTELWQGFVYLGADKDSDWKQDYFSLSNGRWVNETFENADLIDHIKVKQGHILNFALLQDASIEYVLIFKEVVLRQHIANFQTVLLHE